MDRLVVSTNFTTYCNQGSYKKPNSYLHTSSIVQSPQPAFSPSSKKKKRNAYIARFT